MAFLDDLKKGISDAGTKAMEMVDVTRLNSQIGGKHKEIEQLYLKIGEAAFKSMQDQTMSDLPANIQGFYNDIIQKQQEIAQLEQEIAEIKKGEGKS